MISRQFDMGDLKRKPPVGFHWEFRWLEPHGIWMWIKVYEKERSRSRQYTVQPTTKEHVGGKTTILRGE